MVFAASFPERKGKSKMKNIFKVHNSWRGKKEILCLRAAAISSEQVHPYSRRALRNITEEIWKVQWSFRKSSFPKMLACCPHQTLTLRA